MGLAGQDPKDHSGDWSFKDTTMGNDQELPGFVDGDNTDSHNASVLMEEFDTNNEITSSPYGSQPNSTPENSGLHQQHTSTNDVAPVQNQESVSATERHGSEPIAVPASQASGLGLQGLSINASTSTMAPPLATVHPESTDTQPAKKTGRATRQRGNKKSKSPNQAVVVSPLGQGAAANEDASTGGSQNGLGPFPMFFQHGDGNPGLGGQTGGHLADEELGAAMARGSGPSATAPYALVPRGYDFGAEGQQDGQASASVPKVEFNQDDFYGHHWPRNPTYPPPVHGQQHGFGLPPAETTLASAFDYSRPATDNPGLNWYGAPLNNNNVPTNAFDFDPSDYGQFHSEYRFGSNAPSQQAQEHHGQPFDGSQNVLQGDSLYPDPESSRQPVFTTTRMLQPLPVLLPLPLDSQRRPATRSRNRRSVQRQLLPATTPNDSQLVPANVIQLTGDAPNRIALRHGNLEEAERAMSHVNNPVSNDADPTVPTDNIELQRAYVRRILAAMYSVDQARDNDNMIAMWVRQSRNTGAVEQVAWRLLRRCLNAHGQLDPLVPGGRFTRYQSFESRIQAVIYTLLHEKTLCRHAMSSNFLDQFVDDPRGAQHRVHNNRKVNGGKKEAIEQGRRAMEEGCRSVTGSNGSPPLNLVIGAPLNFANGSMTSAGTTNPGSLALTAPPAVQTQPEIDVAFVRSNRLAHLNQEQADKPANKKTAAKRGSAAKSGGGATRKRKTDDDSDSAYQPSSRKPTKKQSNGATKKEYKGKYPKTYNAELGQDVITSLPSPPRSTPAPIQPAPRPDQSFSASGLYPMIEYPATSSHGMGYPTHYQSNTAQSSYMGNATSYQDQQNAMTSVTNSGYPYGPPQNGYGSGFQAPSYGGQYHDTPEAFARTYQHMIDRSSTLDPRLDGRNPLDPSQVLPTESNPLNPRQASSTGDNSLNPTQAVSELAFPHAPGTIAKEFDQDEPEPEELYDFTSPGQRRKRQRKPRGQ